jgi:hypothetical protein
MAELKLGTTIGGSVAWHEGNDGSGSGLDADYLDGNHASAFALSGHTHNYAGSSSAGGAANSVANALTINNGGSGAASGSTYNGSAAVTISYNTVGAAASGHNHDSTYMPISGIANNTDQYVSFRVMRNANSSTSNDGMYIGYSNSNSGATRLFGGGSTNVTALIIAPNTAATNATTGSVQITGGLGVAGAVYSNNTVTGNSLALVGGWNVTDSSGYGVFSNWVGMSGHGIYTTSNTYVDLDATTSTWSVRGTNNDNFLTCEANGSANNGRRISSLPNGGTFGIGLTPTTGDRLEVAGSVRIHTGNNWDGIQFSADGANGYIQGLGDETGLRIRSEYGNIMLADNRGNVVIGSTDPQGYKLRVNGTFAATTKSFLISHPTKEGWSLRYGSLEGPENGVYVRGKLKGGNVIELPGYWTKLVDPDSITVQLTPIGKHQKLYVEDIRDNKVYIANDGLFAGEINCFYYVQGERIDVEKLVVEYE